MRVLMWLVLAVAASVLVVACATGPTAGVETLTGEVQSVAAGATGPTQGSVSIITQIDFTEQPPRGTFEVTEGADVLGCSSGTFVDSPTADAVHKEFACGSGTTIGTFTAEFFPNSGPWKIVDATDGFSGLSGEGDFSLTVDGQPTQAPATEVGASDTAAPAFAAIDRYVQEEMEATRLPGVALGIVKGDEIVHLKGFGDADLSGRAVTPRTPFIIGSVTKSFTALAIMQLVEAGEVELDAPVQRYLPWFRVADPDASTRITVRHLLNHTSGLSAAAGGAYLLKEDANENALENEVRALSTVELNRPVGETFEYSNMNYSILGLIVQTVSGEPYEQYAQGHILTPLEMNDSFAFPPEAERHGLATGHQFWFGRPFSGGGLPYNRAATPSGFISSSAEDMSHYLIAQLNEGRYGDEEILSPEGIAELHRPTVDMMGEEAGPSYAMGWGVNEIDGVTTVSHNGSTGDFHADVILVPEDEWGIVLLTNGDDFLQMGRIDAIARGVTDLLAGREPPPQPMTTLFFEPMRVILFVVLGVFALQVVGIVWSTVLLLRWRARPERRPRGALGVALRVVLPLILNLLWAVAWLVVAPPLLGFLPLWTIAFYMAFTDVDLVVVLSVVVALGWGTILRPVLVFLVLRKRDAPEGTGAPVSA